MNVILLRHTEQPEMLLADAAAACVGKPHGTIKAAQGAIKSGHESLLEHVSFTFLIEGVSRALLAQLTRHRHSSFSVESQRYVPYHDGFDYTVPPRIAQRGEESEKVFDNQMRTLAVWYNGWMQVLGDEGAEDARFVLPNACDTRLILTMNARQLKTFLGLRLCNRAQWEIRELAGKMLEVVLPYLPNVFSERMAKCDQVGYCTERKSCGRKPMLDDILACWEKYGEEWKNDYQQEEV